MAKRKLRVKKDLEFLDQEKKAAGNQNLKRASKNLSQNFHKVKIQATETKAEKERKE